MQPDHIPLDRIELWNQNIRIGLYWYIEARTAGDFTHMREIAQGLVVCEKMGDFYECS